MPIAAHAYKLRVSALACAIFCAVIPSLSAAQDASADQIIQLAQQSVALIDTNKAAQLWDRSAPFVKARYPQAELVRNLLASRQSVGEVKQRTWAGVRRIRQLEATPDGAPVGLYASVDFSTRLADGRTVFELVSFVQQPDGSWLFTGYVPRQAQ